MMTAASTALTMLITLDSPVEEFMPASPSSVKSTFSPPRTLATVRAQRLPRPLAEAIHSQMPAPIRPMTTPKAMATATALSSSLSVSDESASRMLSSMAERCSKVSSAPMADRAAPAYMSFTARAIGAGRVPSAVPTPTGVGLVSDAQGPAGALGGGCSNGPGGGVAVTMCPPQIGRAGDPTSRSAGPVTLRRPARRTVDTHGPAAPTPAGARSDAAVVLAPTDSSTGCGRGDPCGAATGPSTPTRRCPPRRPSPTGHAGHSRRRRRTPVAAHRAPDPRALVGHGDDRLRHPDPAGRLRALAERQALCRRLATAAPDLVARPARLPGRRAGPPAARGMAGRSRRSSLRVVSGGPRAGTLDAMLFREGLEQAVFALGCFWGAERKFWETEGVFTTAVGYAGGFTPNPTNEETCSGLTGHAEAVLVVFDPARVSYDTLLKVFWESHDPTQGMRQGNDVGTQYRSAIYVFGEDQRAAAEMSRDAFQRALTEAGHGDITTEIVEAPAFWYAEDYHQQYLHKNPLGYCGLGGTGVSCPTGIADA